MLCAETARKPVWLALSENRDKEIDNDSKVLAREGYVVFIGHETDLIVFYVWNHSKSLSNEIAWSDLYCKIIFSTLVSIRVTCWGFSKCHRDKLSQRLWECSSGTRLVSTVNSNIQLGLTTRSFRLLLGIVFCVHLYGTQNLLNK